MARKTPIERYRNIGIPANKNMPLSGDNAKRVPDYGLGNRQELDDPSANGLFKVPTLRNVAVTGPYMQIGVFQTLHTAIHFYNQYIVHNDAAMRNHETGEPWGQPKLKETNSLDELCLGQPLDAQRIKALIAFLNTLTDQRYEYLLE